MHCSSANTEPGLNCPSKHYAFSLIRSKFLSTPFAPVDRGGSGQKGRRLGKKSTGMERRALRPGRGPENLVWMRFGRPVFLSATARPWYRSRRPRPAGAKMRRHQGTARGQLALRHHRPLLAVAPAPPQPPSSDSPGYLRNRPAGSMFSFDIVNEIRVLFEHPRDLSVVFVGLEGSPVRWEPECR